MPVLRRRRPRREGHLPGAVPPGSGLARGARAGAVGVNRAEHLAWAKARALELVDAGELSDALTSITSDLRKHPELAGHLGIELGMMLAMTGHLRTPEEMREWIEGFQ